MLVLTCITVLSGCKNQSEQKGSSPSRIPVIFDTDTNNELDDQHALAYLLMNDSIFEVEGVTVNATWGGGDIDKHYEEAVRVIDLCGLKGEVAVFKGANGKFPEIAEHTGDMVFDGSEAVDFIIKESLKEREDTLILLAVGKLTNVALALKKDPSLSSRVQVVWLGSNYPDPGEYNLENDTASLNYVLGTDVPFEMVTVRYGKSSGTAAVKVSVNEIRERMPGLGPVVKEPVTGRHGGSFTNFGDYSVSLFEHIDQLEEGEYRSLFDMAAVAIVKDPSWASATMIPSPVYMNGRWVEQPENRRKITIRENFDRDLIMADFFSSFK